MKIITLLFAFFLAQRLQAQSSSPADTVEYARAKATTKDFAAADRLLISYNARHLDVNGLRLHAQVLYWNKAYERANEVHRRAITSFPDLAVLKLDYGRFLYELGKHRQAQAVLEGYLAHDSLQAEANLLVARICYQEGHLAAAENRAAFMLKHYPGNADATALLTELHQAQAPYLRLSSRYAAADQPLKALNDELESTWYRSWLLAPSLRVQFTHFNLPELARNSIWLQAGNTIRLNQSGLTLNLQGGVFRAQLGSGAWRPTGSVLLTQKVASYLYLDFNAEHRPYQRTLASVRSTTTVMQNVEGAAIRLNKSDRWLGKAVYECQTFADDNTVQTAYAWLLAPLLTTKLATLQGGYALSYATTKRSTYVPVKTLDEIVAANSPVAGYYAPYFSPKNQVVNSLLGSFKIKPPWKVTFSGQASVGVLAKADNPYLFLNKSASNELYVERGFLRTSYHPLDLQVVCQVKISPALSLAADYSYRKLFFFTAQQAGLQLSYHVASEQK
ncbi:tetratricopeptide repeat protein [Hymenobacter sp. GOD-10R]|uniref:tetratricopeptide repeat protein n=1 Tax=Hymenobacter sp. GOD-10R TaxID=3093922 RepID=UPI002D798B59|nr:tetratricopeptide repeat protein [Hymenobacter sp. GOD-10R]WRQ29345.1 tetratricopeptide repeat protein [Hymenobacter sp. GOD-10R]